MSLAVLLVRPLVGLLALAPVAAPRTGEDPPPDRVELANGRVLEGRVLLADDERVVLRVGSKERELARAEVKELRTAAGALREVLAQWERIPPGDAAAILDLARFAGSRGLAGETELLAYLALTVDPANAAAHELVGHDRRGDDWVVRDGARKLLWSRIRTTRRDFRSPWELSTLHYELTTDLELASACALLLELELFYRYFHDTFGAAVGLYEVTQRMPCLVYGDPDAYPDDAKRAGWFDPVRRETNVLAVGAAIPEILVHEAVHQIWWCAAEERRAGCSRVGWLDEGLAELARGRRTGPAGRPVYDDARVLDEHFRAHAAAKRAHDLSRVLTFSVADFADSSRTDLKYAQAYTLAQFAWAGDGGAHRAGFLAFLREAHAGKATSSSLEDALGVKERDLERAWTAHVRARAGV